MQFFYALTLVLLLFGQQTSDRTARFNEALELQRKGSAKEAASAYRKLLVDEPSYMEAHANLGVVLAQLGQFDRAVYAYEAALKLAPDLPPLLLNLGIAHYRIGRFDEAARTFERLLAIAPDQAQARQLLGVSLVELGRDKEAILFLEEAATAAPDDSAVLYSLGLAYLRLNRRELPDVIDRLAVVATPQGAAASKLLRGQWLLARFEFERAVVELEAAAKLNFMLPRLSYSLGLGYLKLNRNKEAIAAFERELQISPKDSSTLFYLGYIHEANGDLPSAEKYLHAALKLDPQLPEANALVGKILVKQNKVVEALGPLETAVANDQADPDKRYMLARVYQQLGRREEAQREFAEVRRLKAEQLKTDRERTPPQKSEN